MLLPTNVMARPWYRELYPEGSPGAPVFVAPHQRYTFSSKDARNGTALSGSIFHRFDRFELDLRGHTQQ